MNYLEYCELQEYVPAVITTATLQDLTPRTLIYGYTCDHLTHHRLTYHLYLTEACKFQWVLYDHDGFLVEECETDELKAEDCIPDKRIYAQKSDFEFCQVLSRMLRRGLNFASFEEVTPALYYGKRIEELVTVAPDEFEAKIELTDADVEAVISGLGSPMWRSHLRFAPQAKLKERLTSILENQTESYLKALRVGAPAERWLPNIPFCVEHSVMDFLRGVGFSRDVDAPLVLDTEVGGRLVAIAKRAADAKLQETCV